MGGTLADMSNADLEAPSLPSPRLRTAGFLCAVLGALLAGAATMLIWIQTSIKDLPPQLIPTYLGIDLPDGLVVLGLAVVIVIAVLVSRTGSAPRGRRGPAVVVIVASFIVIGVSGAAIVTAASRFEPTVVDDILAIVAPDGATPQQRAAVDAQVETNVGTGPWLALAGGVLALAGGIMTLAWTAAAPPDPAPVPDADPTID
jgi:hypothetical protein